MKTNSKKLGYMDMGGNFIDMSNQYQNVEPVSGMGTMVESEFGPKKPKKPSSGSGAKHGRDVYKRQQKRTVNARKQIGNCGNKGCKR